MFSSGGGGDKMVVSYFFECSFSLFFFWSVPETRICVEEEQTKTDLNG